MVFFPRAQENLLKYFSCLVSLAGFSLSLVLYFRFDGGTADFQFVEKVPWIEDFGISYFLGIDGISLFLILLTNLLSVLAIYSSFSAITRRVKEYYIVMLFLQTGMLGVFMALDLFLFYVFWEVMLVPMYFLIGVWGGARKVYATVKFVLYTMAGSLLMLVAILVLYFLNQQATGSYTFDLTQLLQYQVPIKAQFWLFFAFFLAFAIKVPMFPFHTWLPDAHVEAPTAGSVLLAGILLKMGTYGFLRFSLPLFPNAAHDFLPVIVALALIGIIYGALVAMVQSDVKKLVAYSSVSHLGFVMLGIFTFNIIGVQGGILQMINHGLSTGALFLLVGIIYERRHTRLIEEFGGLSRPLPVFAVFFMIVTLSSIGLPGLNGFVGEFLILLGAFKFNWIYAVIAALGVILAAVYMLWMFQRVMFGKVTKPVNEGLKDLNLREFLIFVPIVAAIVLIGVYPNLLLRKMEVTVEHLLNQVQTKYELALSEERR
jgi:NADH-quinone oxidoreductase subunit M